ncbi:helix-turn-helix domain-containing protein, partial [Agrobacterium sp.]
MALREARLTKGMTQTELSKLSGIPQAQISRL